MATQVIDARLLNDTSTMRSLFTGKLTSVSNIKLELSPIAKGTANFAIFENDVQKVNERVTAGGSVSWAPAAGSEVEFYVNYYDESDMAQAFAVIS
ncbi:MAG: hypothetical protein EOP56_01040 [Sphingobacteriales bacterium]|nr:MAG: hypothetical protein EOP56_01040 [Sphingobacteriales bacterium]